MNIVGKITGIKYQVLFTEDLKEVKIKNFDINEMPSACLLINNKHTFAISKWVSPKRTRSYPFERVYNTLHISKKITVIPVVKDEGAKGDRDFIQWDTVLNLTSSKLKGAITSTSTKKDIANFFIENSFSTQQIKLVETIFAEAKQNSFIIQIQFSK